MAHRSHACQVEFGLGSEQIIKPSYQLHSAWPAACPGSQSCLKIKGLLSPEAKFASASPPALRGASSSEQLQVSPLCPQVNPTFISYHPLQAVPDSGAELGETVAGVTCTSIGATEGGPPGHLHTSQNKRWKCQQQEISLEEETQVPAFPVLS